MPQAYANTVSASDALKKMNEIIAFRLAVHELIPADLQHLDTRKPGLVNSLRGNLTLFAARHRRRKGVLQVPQPIRMCHHRRSRRSAEAVVSRRCQVPAYGETECEGQNRYI
jgi:hypothetical protein